MSKPGYLSRSEEIRAQDGQVKDYFLAAIF